MATDGDEMETTRDVRKNKPAPDQVVRVAADVAVSSVSAMHAVREDDVYL